VAGSIRAQAPHDSRSLRALARSPGVHLEQVDGAGHRRVGPSDDELDVDHAVLREEVG
jgi:hypothetical protein